MIGAPLWKTRIAEHLAELEAQGARRHVKQRLTPGLVNLAGNDYLGLAADRTLREAFLASSAGHLALSSSSSPLLTGWSEAHEALAEHLGRIYGKRALLFPSGWHANTGLVGALGRFFGRGAFFAADRLVHASMVDGLLAARNAGAGFARWRHNDLAHLERLLEAQCPVRDVVFVLVEALYSMDGDRTDLEGLAALKRRHPNVVLVVDEAHSVGVLGEGLGLAVETGLAAEADLLVLTFGKALGGTGAAVLGDPIWCELLENHARPLIYSTAESPLAAAWTLFLFERLEDFGARRARLFSDARRLAERLGRKAAPPSPIVPIPLGSNERVLRAAAALEARGFLVSAVRAPTVPAGTERLRVSLSAAVAPKDFDDFLEILPETLAELEHEATLGPEHQQGDRS